MNSDIEAERDHLRIGDHYVRLMTMRESIAETRPMVLDQLLKIDANFHVVTEWAPLSTAKARKEITMRRRHFNVAKTGFFSHDEGREEARTRPGSSTSPSRPTWSSSGSASVRWVTVS